MVQDLHRGREHHQAIVLCIDILQAIGYRRTQAGVAYHLDTDIALFAPIPAAQSVGTPATRIGDRVARCAKQGDLLDQEILQNRLCNNGE